MGYHQAVGGDPENNFPVPFLMTIITYSFVLFIEKIAFQSHSLLHEHPGHHHEQAHRHAPRAHPQQVAQNSKELENVNGNPRPKSPEENEKNLELEIEAKAHGSSKKEELSIGAAQIASKFKIENKANGNEEPDEDMNEELFKGFMNYKMKLAYELREMTKSEADQDGKLNESIEMGIIGDHKEAEAQISQKNLLENHPRSEAPEILENNQRDQRLSDSQSESHGHPSGRTMTLGQKLKPFLFLSALSFHGMVEGIAMGLQGTLYGTMNLCLAILLHKWAEALTLGVSFSKNKINQCTSVPMIVFFSFVGPIGIVLGLILSGLGQKASSIIMSCATGKPLTSCFPSQIRKSEGFHLNSMESNFFHSNSPLSPLSSFF